MRLASLLLLAGAATAAVAADDRVPHAPATPVDAFVSLDRPGALEALAAKNPDHYRRAVGILRIASDMPCEGLPRVIQADFKAALAQCEGSLIRTSWPAQREVSFVLDHTRYSARVYLTERETLTPLVDRR